jgi:hypothetical protein
VLLKVFLVKRSDLLSDRRLDPLYLQLVETLNQIDHLEPFKFVCSFHSIDLHTALGIALVPDR